MKIIDAHIHYAESLGANRLNQVIEELQVEAVALQCIPKGGVRPVEADAFAFARQSRVPVYIFGGLDRKIYHILLEYGGKPSSNTINTKAPDSGTIDTKTSNGEIQKVDCYNSWIEMSNALVNEISRLMDMGCTGIKMLEGKPDVKKQCQIPAFDAPVWEEYWACLERERIPVYFHVNDPQEFWNPQEVSEFAKSAGWFYDETYPNNEEQYRQVLQVLERHPKLKILFPHFFFLSKQLPRMAKILDTYPNVRIDLTPGIELYYNLSEQIEEAKSFFHQYQNRICYGTDIGARAVIRSEQIPLSIEESYSRVKLIRRFLETDGEYELYPDGQYVNGSECVRMHGLGLSKEILQKIYSDNFMEFIKK